MASSTPSSSETASDGPVMSLFYKRLRALRKKLNRIAQIEEKAHLEGEKALNGEQLAVLRSKACVIAVVEELDRMQAAMTAAVAEEVAVAAKDSRNECQGKKTRSKNKSNRCQSEVDNAPVYQPNKDVQLPVETIMVQSEVDSAPVYQPEELNSVQLPVETVLVQSESEVESAPVQFQQKVEEPAVYQENGTYDSQSSYVEEAPKVESQPEDLITKDVSQTNSQQEEPNNEESEWTEINKNGSRRNHNNSRGRGRGRGGRRGGGPYYSNGQRSQNSENGNFYPRSYYNKGRGGGNVGNNHSPGAAQGVTAV